MRGHAAARRSWPMGEAWGGNQVYGGGDTVLVGDALP